MTAKLGHATYLRKAEAALSGAKLLLKAGDTDGEALNTVQRFRQLADYTEEAVSLADVTWAVEQAEAFVKAIRTKFLPDKEI